MGNKREKNMLKKGKSERGRASSPLIIQYLTSATTLQRMRSPRCLAPSKGPKLLELNVPALPGEMTEEVALFEQLSNDKSF